MNQVRVIAPGMESSIQDLGRFGWAHFGVSASGAADALALRAGNLLVGNAENAAGLEMTLAGAELEFESAAVIALTGSDFGSGLPLWCPVEIPAGSRVRCAATGGGARCYLVGARRHRSSKDHGQRLGPPHNRGGRRPLRKGDVLAIGDAAVRRPRKPARGLSAAGIRLPPCGSRPGRRPNGSADEIVSQCVHRVRGIQPHGSAAARASHPRRRRAHDQRRGIAGRGSGAARWPADHPVRRPSDHGRVSQTCQRDFRRFLEAGTNARRATKFGSNSVTIDQALRSSAGAGGVAVFCEAEEILLSRINIEQSILNLRYGRTGRRRHEAALMEYITSANIACGGTRRRRGHHGAHRPPRHGARRAHRRASGLSRPRQLRAPRNAHDARRKSRQTVHGRSRGWRRW